MVVGAPGRPRTGPRGEPGAPAGRLGPCLPPKNGRRGAPATNLYVLRLNIITTAIPVINDHFNSVTGVGLYGSAFMLAL